MIDLFELYEKVCGTFNTQQGGHIRPHRNFVDWVNDVSIELFEEYVAVAEKNQQISDYLTPFLKSVNVVVNPIAGTMYDVIKFPTDYEHYGSARVFYNSNETGCPCQGLPIIDGKDGKECENPYQDEDDKIKAQLKSEEGLCESSIIKVDNQRWGSICGHKTMSPTKKNPKITQFDGGFKIAPKQLGVIVLDYYRKPVKATFDYTITNPGNIDEYLQYNSGTSTKLEWSSVLVNEFVNRIGKKYGKFIREQFIFETSELDRKVTI